MSQPLVRRAIRAVLVGALALAVTAMMRPPSRAPRTCAQAQVWAQPQPHRAKLHESAPIAPPATHTYRQPGPITRLAPPRTLLQINFRPCETKLVRAPPA